MTNETTRRIARVALMIALIFVCTFTIKLPNPATGGYTHMGDCMAFLAVLVLGKKDGALAAGLGAALSDLEYIKLDRDKSTFKSHRDFSSEIEITLSLIHI